MLILSYIPHRHLAIAAILALIVGLVSSKALISIAMFTLVGNGLLNRNILQNFKKWLKDIPSVLFLLFFLAYVLSGFNSADSHAWMERCRIKLPFIAMPFGFAALRPFSKNLINKILLFYVLVIAAAAIWMLTNYMIHFQTFNTLLMQGKPIPAPMNEHIRFSLEIAFAIICGGYLVLEKNFLKHRYQKYVVTTLALFLFVCIHVFAVRSGIFTLYASLICIIIYFVLQKKHFLTGIFAMVALIIIGIAAVNVIPSLKNRIGYFRYELDLIRKNEIKAEHSDAQRLVSIQLGLELAKENWLTGVGAGDIKNEMTEKYRQHFNEEPFTIKTPHNQFIYVWVCTGILGLMIFVAAFFYPVFLTSLRKDYIFIGFFITIFLSLFTEHTFEIQIGTAFYTLFIMLFLNQRKNKIVAHA